MVVAAARERLAGFKAEVALGDRTARAPHVAFNEFGFGTQLEPAKRSDRLEHDEDAALVALEVLRFDVAAGDDDLERLSAPAIPDRGTVTATAP